MDAKGFNEHGVLMCECKPYGRAHAYEPGEWCSPTHVLPLEAQKLAVEQQRDRLLEAVKARFEAKGDGIYAAQGHLYETAKQIEGERAHGQDFERYLPLQTIREMLTSDEAIFDAAAAPFNDAGGDGSAYVSSVDPKERALLLADAHSMLAAAFDRAFPDTKDKGEQR